MFKMNYQSLSKLSVYLILVIIVALLSDGCGTRKKRYKAVKSQAVPIKKSKEAVASKAVPVKKHYTSYKVGQITVSDLSKKEAKEISQFIPYGIKITGSVHNEIKPNDYIVGFAGAKIASVHDLILQLSDKAGTVELNIARLSSTGLITREDFSTLFPIPFQMKIKRIGEIRGYEYLFVDKLFQVNGRNFLVCTDFDGSYGTNRSSGYFYLFELTKDNSGMVSSKTIAKLKQDFFYQVEISVITNNIFVIQGLPERYTPNWDRYKGWLRTYIVDINKNRTTRIKDLPDKKLYPYVDQNIKVPYEIGLYTGYDNHDTKYPAMKNFVFRDKSRQTLYTPSGDKIGNNIGSSDPKWKPVRQKISMAPIFSQKKIQYVSNPDKNYWSALYGTDIGCGKFKSPITGKAFYLKLFGEKYVYSNKKKKEGSPKGCRLYMSDIDFTPRYGKGPNEKRIIRNAVQSNYLPYGHNISASKYDNYLLGNLFPEDGYIDIILRAGKRVYILKTNVKAD